jgi:hypothetical protein
MTTATDTNHVSHPPDPAGHIQVRVNDRLVRLHDTTPTGEQILAAADLQPADEFALLLWQVSGPTRECALDEIFHLPSEGPPPLAFFAHRADGVRYFVLDDARYAWAGPLDARTVRVIGRVPEERELWLERQNEPDAQLDDSQSIHLEHAGVEKLYTRKRVWLLDVQGERTEWHHPIVIVRDALERAGFDLEKKWVVVLRVKGKPPRPVELADPIDLREPGIERLRVRPADVNNGEGPTSPRRDFGLLPKDEAFLTASGFEWETIKEAGKHWVVILNYLLPVGYDVASCRLAVEIPEPYPTAQLDMFYCDPPLVLANGTAPAATQKRVSINGISFQRWSRHRVHPWSAGRDGLATHFGLIEESLAREVGA